MSKIERIATDKAPAAIGPYSQGIAAGELVFTSGQIPVNPQTKEVPEGIQAQTKQALENLKAVLEGAGSGLDKVIKVLVFIVDMSEFKAVNEIYAQYFKEPYPARSCVAVRELPLGVRVEIEAVAVK
ncbi:RidA family protein [Desulfovibrio sp. OttesenSCG-928-C14]|nr:RidA family protein [Desulfovibrio sp. OttesenSCG-928-C14]